MKILVMCGGRGKRMGKITAKIPKPLTKINGKVVLGLKIDQYIKQGFKDYIFCISYKGQMIIDFIQKKYKHINAEFSDAGKTAGILKRLFYASQLFSDSVLMTYGDTISKINLIDFIARHENGNNDTTVALAAIKNPFGIVEYDQNMMITSFQEKPVFHYYIGYAIVNKNILLKMPNKTINGIDGEGIVAFYNKLIEINKLGSYLYLGHKITFNTLEEYDKAKKEIKVFYTIPTR